MAKNPKIKDGTNFAYKFRAYPDIKQLEIIEEALKRNEPMKVDLTTARFERFYKCPNCGGYNNMERSSYCPDCGQRLDWSDK